MKRKAPLKADWVLSDARALALHTAVRATTTPRSVWRRIWEPTGQRQSAGAAQGS